MGVEDFLRAAGTVTKRLGRWLEEHGYVDGAVAADVANRGAEAARDLPQADRLAIHDGDSGYITGSYRIKPAQTITDASA